MTPLDLVDGAETVADEPTKLGRKRDHSRDGDILTAALEVLAETGFDGMTIDMVAARAKAGKATLYRRWPSKAELVVDAVGCMKAQAAPQEIPDTGTLRGDLVAMIKTPTINDAERKLQIMAGVVSLVSRNPELADAVRSSIVEPRAALNRMFLQRAIDRGEISAETDVATLSVLSPAMVAYRVLMERQPVTREFALSIIDGIVLPAVGLKAPSAAE